MADVMTRHMSLMDNVQKGGIISAWPRNLKTANILNVMAICDPVDDVRWD